jgi:hypothetical protein
MGVGLRRPPSVPRSLFSISAKTRCSLSKTVLIALGDGFGVRSGEMLGFGVRSGEMLGFGVRSGEMLAVKPSFCSHDPRRFRAERGVVASMMHMCPPCYRSERCRPPRGWMASSTAMLRRLITSSRRLTTKSSVLPVVVSIRRSGLGLDKGRLRSLASLPTAATSERSTAHARPPVIASTAR